MYLRGSLLLEAFATNLWKDNDLLKSTYRSDHTHPLYQQAATHLPPCIKSIQTKCGCLSCQKKGSVIARKSGPGDDRIVVGTRDDTANHSCVSY